MTIRGIFAAKILKTRGGEAEKQNKISRSGSSQVVFASLIPAKPTQI